MTYPIEEVYAWIVDDPTGKHAIISATLPNGLLMQAVSSQRSLMEHPKMRRVAEQAAEDTGLAVRLVRFKADGYVDEIDG